MAQQLINVGSQPNAGDGDPLRIAFGKINANFTELYTAASAVGGNTSTTSTYVESVAGKSGKVLLTVDDVVGAVSPTYVYNMVTTEVSSQMGAITNNAPEVLNTLSELANAIQNNPNFSTDIYSQLSDRLSKSAGGTVSGDLLVNRDPTVGLQVATKQYVDRLITGVVAGSVPAATANTLGTVKVGTNLTISADGTLSAVTPSNIYTAAEVDTLLAAKEDSANLSNVAHSGSYADLLNKPTLFSGSYTDLTDKPALAAVALSGHWVDIIDPPHYPNVVPVPTSSVGQAGDAASDIAFDANYFYYCVGDYDGTTNIWRRIASDATPW